MEIITRCGMRCNLCPAYLPNRSDADLEKAAAIWAEIFDVHIPSEEIACCGCLNEREMLLDTECPVRPCVMEKGLAHCGECPDMPCPNLKRRWVDRGEIEAKIGRRIPDDDYERYVRPFENAPFLESCRRGRDKG
jgi:hypothetical protein